MDICQGFDEIVALTAQKIKAVTLEPYKANMTRLVSEHKALQENDVWFGKGKRKK